MGAHVQPLRLRDVLLLEPELVEDERGNFFEAWNQAEFAAVVGVEYTFVQDNQSQSKRGVVRGLHYQLPNPQGKLVRVTAGATFTVAVDIRQTSPTFGEWVSAELSAHNRCQLWVPPGFAHGFMALVDSTEILYKVTTFYRSGCDQAIRWDDPAIGIEWPTEIGTPILSERDIRAPLLANAKVFD